jgi:putative ATP-dependent endonuclease of OLD family
MFLAELRIENFRMFGENAHAFALPLKAGLTALVGENDTGKTAVIDALRFVLGTRDQEYCRVEDSDFHWPPGTKERRTQIRIRCKFDDLTTHDKGAFAEYLTYVERDGHQEAVLHVNWTAKGTAGARSSRRFVSVDLRSGETGDGPVMDTEVRNLLRSTYLRPLRDAERAMSAGRGSRLSQILQHTKEIKEIGDDYDPQKNPTPDPATLSVLGVGDYANTLLGDRQGIKGARERLNNSYLKPLSFSGANLTGHISVSPAGDKDSRLRQLLEKLELELNDENADAPANRGLGSNNLLFMACELLLLGSEEDGFPLLLVEEPEAHLHPQRQLRLMQFLQAQAGTQRGDGQQIQIIVTTHSPNFASAIKLDNLVIIQNGKAFPLIAGTTGLEKSDYRFLERFLDVTKANLFFARGVVIVEGDGENILIHTLALLIGRDFAEHGVSIVNVGHTGLRRFARIFQRKEPDKDGVINVPVACIADMDVMPDCAPLIIGKVKEGDDWPDKTKRGWRAKSDFTEETLAARREEIRQRANGQLVKSFVSDEWTLEYDLAYSGLAEDVWIAAHLARVDDRISAGTRSKSAVEKVAKKRFEELTAQNPQKEQLASKVYALFTTGKKASKAIAAQYLAERLEQRSKNGELTGETLKACLPPYLLTAIEYVAPVPAANAAAEQGKTEAHD